MYKKPKLYLVPGPVTIPKSIRKIYQRDFGSGMLETEFVDLYLATEKLWQKILRTKNSIVMMTGEPMLGLWSGLKSCLKPGDKVLAISNGFFGEGIGAMAASIGANVKYVKFDYNTATNDLAKIETAIKWFQPKMITAVHCETPTGILNPIGLISTLKSQHKVPLFYVDAVASIGGTLVDVDDWQIDICLGGPQKVPSAFPDIAFLTVSKTAWETAKKINYPGYDSLLSFQNPAQYPYTPHWHGVAALHEAAKNLLAEGLAKTFARHSKVAQICRDTIREIGLELFPLDENYAAPTVTAIKVPENISWSKLDHELRQQGLLLAGSCGELQNKIFRIGHMGSQADLHLLEKGLHVLRRVVTNLTLKSHHAS